MKINLRGNIECIKKPEPVLCFKIYSMPLINVLQVTLYMELSNIIHFIQLNLKSKRVICIFLAKDEFSSAVRVTEKERHLLADKVNSRGTGPESEDDQRQHEL